MAKGYTGVVLRVDLSARRIEKVEFDDDFYRMYLGGGAIGSYFLLKETATTVDAFDEANILTFAPGVTTGAQVSGASRCDAVALSPVSGGVGEGQMGGWFGPMIKLAGYDAIVITGRADEPVYLFVDGGEIEIRNAAHLWGRNVSDVHDALSSECAKPGYRVSVAQCGPAGERLVRFACIMGDRADVVGRTGLGAVMGSKNLRAVVVRAETRAKVELADADGVKRLAALAAERLKTADFPMTLREFGTPGVVGFQSKNGNMATHNYTKGCHEQFESLTGQSFKPLMDAGKSTCYGCVIACRKRVRTGPPYNASDKLGGPEFETLSTLGSNLDIADAAAVAKANEMCNEYGLDTITAGAIAAYLFECSERNLINPDLTDGRSLKFGAPDDLFWLIDIIGRREGVGAILAEGFAAAVSHFGESTRQYAVHCKGQGLPAHMAQVKPSQALMYATIPIGGDHMSSEHDWLLASGGELCRGLGILGKGPARSTDLNKVRMTVNSQHYYSLLDTLCLCMFVWGPGNIYTYNELTQFVKYCTGWDCTFFELLKAGERRTNMMRLINARRGFTRKEDILPARLFEPLTGGPSEGAKVDAGAFAGMLEQYYALMGWEASSGNPGAGKLMELGLESFAE
jgi:aldehyde:ferredoxin oxidoreductase